MAAPRTGSEGALTTKGDILVFDGNDMERLPVGTNGQVLTADSTQPLGVKYATPAASTARTLVFLGGANMGAGDTGKHFGAQDNAAGGRLAALSSLNQMTSSITGTINLVTWNTATGGVTDVLKINKNGLVVATFNLTGASGSIVVSVAVAIGDLIAVEFDAGPALGNTTVQVWAS